MPEGKDESGAADTQMGRRLVQNPFSSQTERLQIERVQIGFVRPCPCHGHSRSQIMAAPKRD